MNVFSASPSSSSSPSSTFTLITPSQNPNPSKFHYLSLPSKTFLHSSSSRPIFPPLSSNQSQSSPILQENPQSSRINESQANPDEEISSSSSKVESLDETLVARRPVMEIPGGEEEEDGDDRKDVDNRSLFPSPIDDSLSKFAKKMPIFEPDRIQLKSGEKPLMVNLDLALYRAKVLARKFQYDEAEKILRKCISYWPEDGRPYVALGKILSKQSKRDEARDVYETGCQATQGENAYIWQCWAVLENRSGNIRRARELFDAATVADKKHIAAWHGWAVLELKQGNVQKARDLLGKGLKFCGGNEYIYQTLALLEARASRFEQSRYLFKQATKSNPKSCASWLAWAQLEMQLENSRAARGLFEKAVQASPKNRFAWHVWGVFEADMGNIDLGRKLLKVGHAVNPRDPVLLQSLALLEYKHSTANLSRVLFRKASELDPRHQPVWIAWGWMEWKEGNLGTARELYQKALSINSSSESAARCLQAWGVLEQRVGNLSAARRLLRSSLNVNSQSYVTWMTWASLEEDQGNTERAEEIRELYFQQRTEVVDDASWVTGFLDVIDPAVDSIKRFLNFDESPINKANAFPRRMSGTSDDGEEPAVAMPGYVNGSNMESGFNLDAFIRDKLSLDPSNLDIQLESSENPTQKRTMPGRKVWRPSTMSSTP